METHDFSKQPISNVVWVHRDTLVANDYNPNAVAPQELDLLEISILEDGWVSAIATLQEQDGKREIVDGFHRWLTSGRPKVYAMTGGYVPVTTVTGDRVHQKMTTVRMNRARGTHGVVRMADIVQSMIESGVAADSIAKGLGMEDEEVVRLANRNGIPVSMLGQNYGQAWKPKG